MDINVKKSWLLAELIAVAYGNGYQNIKTPPQTAEVWEIGSQNYLTDGFYQVPAIFEINLSDLQDELLSHLKRRAILIQQRCYSIVARKDAQPKFCLRIEKWEQAEKTCVTTQEFEDINDLDIVQECLNKCLCGTELINTEKASDRLQFLKSLDNTNSPDLSQLVEIALATISQESSQNESLQDSSHQNFQTVLSDIEKGVKENELTIQGIQMKDLFIPEDQRQKLSKLSEWSLSYEPPPMPSTSSLGSVLTSSQSGCTQHPPMPSTSSFGSILTSSQSGCTQHPPMPSTSSLGSNLTSSQSGCTQHNFNISSLKSRGKISKTMPRNRRKGNCQPRARTQFTKNMEYSLNARDTEEIKSTALLEAITFSADTRDQSHSSHEEQSHTVHKEQSPTVLKEQSHTEHKEQSPTVHKEQSPTVHKEQSPTVHKENGCKTICSSGSLFTDSEQAVELSSPAITPGDIASQAEYPQQMCQVVTEPPICANKNSDFGSPNFLSVEPEIQKMDETVVSDVQGNNSFPIDLSSGENTLFIPDKSFFKNQVRDDDEMASTGDSFFYWSGTSSGTGAGHSAVSLEGSSCNEMTVLSACSETDNPSSTTHQTNTPSSSTHQTNTPSSSTHQTNTPSSSTHQTNTPSSSAHQTNTPSSSAHQTNTPLSATHQTNTPSYSAHQTNTPSYSAHQTNTPSSSAHQTNTPSSSAHQTNTPSSSAHQTNTPSSSAHQTNTPSSSTHKAHTLITSKHQTQRTSSSTHHTHNKGNPKIPMNQEDRTSSKDTCNSMTGSSLLRMEPSDSSEVRSKSMTGTSLLSMEPSDSSEFRSNPMTGTALLSMEPSDSSEVRSNPMIGTSLLSMEPSDSSEVRSNPMIGASIISMKSSIRTTHKNKTFGPAFPTNTETVSCKAKVSENLNKSNKKIFVGTSEKYLINPPQGSSIHKNGKSLNILERNSGKMLKNDDSLLSAYQGDYKLTQMKCVVQLSVDNRPTVQLPRTPNHRHPAQVKTVYLREVSDVDPTIKKIAELSPSLFSDTQVRVHHPSVSKLFHFISSGDKSGFRT